MIALFIILFLGVISAYMTWSAVISDDDDGLDCNPHETSWGNEQDD